MALRLFRWLSFLLALAAGATAWVWSAHPEWVGSAEWHWLDRYKGDAALRIGEIKKAHYLGDFATHLDEVRSLREQYSDSKYGDRFFAVWRAAAELESQALMALERPEEALPWLEKATRKDEFSVPLATRYLDAKAMVAPSAPISGEEALPFDQALMRDWYHRLPYHPHVVASQHLRWLLTKDWESWASALPNDIAEQARYLKRDWQAFLFLEGDGGILSSPLKDLKGPDAAGRYRFVHRYADVPASMTRVRLDPPSTLPMWLEGLSMQVRSGPDAEVVWQQDIPNHLDAVWAQDGRWIVEDSPDQKLTYRVEGAIPVEGPVEVEVTFAMGPILGESLRKALQDPQARAALQAELVRQGQTVELDRISPTPWDRYR